MINSIAFIGPADAGKSTIIGRLLMSTGSIPGGLVRQVKKVCSSNSITFQPAYLVDYMRAEIEKKCTLERAIAELKIGRHSLTVIDTPGQLMLSSKMVGGLTEADIAVIVVDAENADAAHFNYFLTLARLAGAQHIVVAINKMDILNYEQKPYIDILSRLGIDEGTDMAVCPISAAFDEGISGASPCMRWHGKSLMDTLVPIVSADNGTVSDGFILPVQSVFQNNGGSMVCGMVTDGRITSGQEVRVYSGNGVFDTAVVRLYRNGEPAGTVRAGDNAEVVLAGGYPVSRGDVVAGAREFVVSNALGMRLYSLENINTRHIGEYSLKIMKGSYGVSAITVIERHDCQLSVINALTHDDGNFLIFSNEFATALIALNQPALLAAGREAERAVLTDSNGQVVAFGAIVPHFNI